MIFIKLFSPILFSVNKIIFLDLDVLVWFPSEMMKRLINNKNITKLKLKITYFNQAFVQEYPNSLENNLNSLFNILKSGHYLESFLLDFYESQTCPFISNYLSDYFSSNFTLKNVHLIGSKFLISEDVIKNLIYSSILEVLEISYCEVDSKILSYLSKYIKQNSENKRLFVDFFGFIGVPVSDRCSGVRRSAGVPAGSPGEFPGS